MHYTTDLEGDNNQNYQEPKTTLVSRNITVFGRRTSVRLEPEMWTALREISAREGCSIHDICTLISLRKKENTSLTAAIRVFLMLYFRAATTEEGHKRAKHGSFEFMKQRARVPVQFASKFSVPKDSMPHYRGMNFPTRNGQDIGSISENRV
jgi:predicted DNA-binding ribbon-helix-helix protein